MDLQNDDNWGPPMTITNNVVYNIANNIASGHTAGMIVGSRTTSYVYNNTVYKVYNASGAAWGILAKSWGGTQEATVIAKNNYSADTQTDNIADYDYATSDGATLTQSYNVASETTASGTGSIDSQSAYSTYFTDISEGSEDFHLTDTAANLWGG